MGRRRLVGLADTSVWISSARGNRSLHAEMDTGTHWDRIATCHVVRLELMAGARNPRDLRSIQRRLDLLRDCAIDARVWRRAAWVLERVSELPGERHRGIGPGDVVIAAAAEAAQLPVLHRDRHFELIAAVTGQPTVWFGRPPAPAA